MRGFLNILKDTHQNDDVIRTTCRSYHKTIQKKQQIPTNLEMSDSESDDYSWKRDESLTPAQLAKRKSLQYKQIDYADFAKAHDSVTTQQRIPTTSEMSDAGSWKRGGSHTPTQRTTRKSQPFKETKGDVATYATSANSTSSSNMDQITKIKRRSSKSERHNTRSKRHKNEKQHTKGKLENATKHREMAQAEDLIMLKEFSPLSEIWGYAFGAGQYELKMHDLSGAGFMFTRVTDPLFRIYQSIAYNDVHDLNDLIKMKIRERMAPTWRPTKLPREVFNVFSGYIAEVNRQHPNMLERAAKLEGTSLATLLLRDTVRMILSIGKQDMSDMSDLLDGLYKLCT